MEQDRQTRREGDASRQRGWSVATDGSLDVDTKRRLLDSMPHYDYSIDDGTAHQKQSSSAAAGSSSAGRKRASSDMSDSSSSDMFGSDEAGGEKKKSKRARHHQHHDGRIPEAVAQGRLSKWAARLFDPDRPRGLIETPQVIPLNDEFLQAFGQRERAFDKARGVTDLEIDKEIHDDDDDKGTIQAPVGVPKAVNNGENKGVKVKISNLKFTTSSKALLETCCAFGTVLNLNLLMEEENPSNENDNQQLNKGRAYVVFETEEGAKACIDGLEVLDGRPLRVELASSGGATGRSSMGKSLSSSRYYDKDISTKCFRCGEVGHREAECTNPARAKPCPICAGLDHDIKNCPIKPVCYNCGAPGHVSKNCTQPRGLPPKSICTVSFLRVPKDNVIPCEYPRKRCSHSIPNVVVAYIRYAFRADTTNSIAVNPIETLLPYLKLLYVWCAGR